MDGVFLFGKQGSGGELLVSDPLGYGGAVTHATSFGKKLEWNNIDSYRGKSSLLMQTLYLEDRDRGRGKNRNEINKE